MSWQQLGSWSACWGSGELAALLPLFLAGRLTITHPSALESAPPPSSRLAKGHCISAVISCIRNGRGRKGTLTKWCAFSKSHGACVRVTGMNPNFPLRGRQCSESNSDPHKDYMFLMKTHLGVCCFTRKVDPMSKVSREIRR